MQKYAMFHYGLPTRFQMLRGISAVFSCSACTRHGIWLQNKQSTYEGP